MKNIFSVPLLVAAACHLSACANTGSAAEPVRPESAQGGPAPAAILAFDQVQALKSILSQYRPDRLDEQQARALLEALAKAGLADGPALHKAMADLGFSAKQVSALANTTQSQQKPATRGAVTPSGRVVPPRQ
jgi:hypothetical protein